MKTLKVFVDDHRKTPDGWEEVRTVFHAQRLLATGRVDVISLDNDKLHATKLESGLYLAQGTPCDEEYMAIAYAIAMAKDEYRPGKVIFHTTNGVAARVMESLLLDAGYLPQNLIVRKYDANADIFYTQFR